MCMWEVISCFKISFTGITTVTTSLVAIVTGSFAFKKTHLKKGANVTGFDFGRVYSRHTSKHSTDK